MPTEPQRSKQLPLVTKHLQPLGEHGGEDAYKLYRHSGVDDEGRAQVKHGIMMGVTHHPSFTSYSYHTERASFGNPGRDLNTPGPGGQLKLLGQWHREGTSNVSFMESTKESRIHAPMLLAMAQLDTMRQYGRELDASENRSGHSEKLVQHLQGKVGKQFQERTDFNSMTFDTESEGSNSRASVEHTARKAGRGVASDSEIRGAQRTVRRILRPPLQGPKKPEWEQPRLFNPDPEQMKLPLVNPPTTQRQLPPPR